MSEPSRDFEALESYLAEALDTTVTGTEVLADGLNLIVSVSTGDGEYVLRRPNELREAEYMNDLAGEYGVLCRLSDTPVEAPDPVLFCEDESVLGDRFFVMSAVDGTVVPLGSDLPEGFRDPASRRRVAHLLVDALADVHAVDPEPFEAVCDRVHPRDAVRRSLDRLEAAADVTGHDVSTLRSVGEWLLANAPEPSDTTLVHGDFRPGNVHFTGGDPPEIAGILDWETAELGNPLSDLGYLLLRWRDEGDPTPSLAPIRERYSSQEAIDDLAATNETGLAPFTSKPGSPTRRELVDRYEDATGRTFENDCFHRARAAFDLATVWEDLHRQAVEDGRESEREPYVDYMAAVADSIVRGDLPL